MTQTGTGQFEWHNVDVLILADAPADVRQQIQRVEENFAHQLRPWVGRITVVGDCDKLVDLIGDCKQTGHLPVVLLACAHATAEDQLEICMTLSQVDEHILLVLLDAGQAITRKVEPAGHLVNPQRFVELPMPLTPRYWQQLLVSMARMQSTITQQHKLLSHTQTDEQDQQLIKQLTQANVNAACMLAELEEARDKAMTADIAKSHFLANMTHELRTPLAAIMGFADLMRDDVQLSDEHCEFTKCIYENGQSLLCLLDDILHLTMLEAGEMSPTLSRYCPARALQTLYADWHPRANAKGLALYMFIDDAPQLYGQWLLDENWIRHILDKLLANAIKFTLAGQIAITLQWRQIDHGQTLCYAISDTGIGIASEHLDDIFNEFHQADNTSTRQFGGMGLGLAICRKLTHRLGGEIHVSSEPGKGSCFDLILPLEQAHVMA